MERGMMYTRAATLQSAAAATGDGTPMDVTGLVEVVIQVSGSFTATIDFKATTGAAGGTYTSVEGANVADGTKASSTTSTDVIFRIPVAGMTFLKTPVTWTSGTSVTVIARGYTVSSASLADVSATLSGAIDTELPAAAALADNTANPTVPGVGAFGMIWDGATWDRLPGTSSDGLTVNTELPAAVSLADNLSNPTSPLVGASTLFYDGTNWRRARNISSDGTNGNQMIAVENTLYNSSDWDRWRNNHNATVLASAARTADTQSSDQVNYNARGAHIIISVTAAAGTPSIVYTVQGKDSISGSYYTILASAAIVGIGTTVLKVYPGITAAANASVSDILPRTWRIDYNESTGDSVTSSVSVSYVV